MTEQRLENVRERFASPEELAVSPASGRSKFAAGAKRFVLWLYLMTKRLLKKPSFVLILLMLPAVLLIYRAVITEDDGKLHVALYFEERDELAERFLGEVKNQMSEIFLFYECEEEEDLYSDVAAGRAECGYVFPAGMAETILTDEWLGMITAVTSERTVYGGIVNEIVYDRLSRTFSYEVTLDYLVRRSGLDITREEAGSRLRELFAKSMEGPSFVQYVTVDSAGRAVDDEVRKAESVLTKPIRGTVAIFVLLTGMAGLVFWFQDDAEGRYRVMAREKRPLISFASILMPTALAGIAGLLCLGISGLWSGAAREILPMACYVLFVTAFCNILRFLIPSVHAVCATIPILVLISYLCCPIIIDIEILVPAIRFVRAALLPQYYLRFYEGSSVIALVVGTAVLVGISALLSVPERNR